MSGDNIKKIIRDKYGAIVNRTKSSQLSTCCGSSDSSACCSGISDYSVFNDDYSQVDGYIAEADLNLGCGLPTEFAGIKKGQTVVDLGSGAGNDVFVARQLVGKKGRVIGVDMTPDMVLKARENNTRLGFENVEFRLGEIEALPIENASVDVVISNCVLNLVPDKILAFGEIFRVLKPGAHFCISDIVYRGEMSERIRRSAELYAGCIAGSLEEDDYLDIIKGTGFRKVEIKKRKRIDLPPEVWSESLTVEDLAKFKISNFGLFSITVVAFKPSE